MIDKVNILTALVVDDHPVTHLGCRSLLSELGFSTILEAQDDQSALLEIENSPPNLILLDLNLPGTGGLKLLPQIIDKLDQVNCIAPILVFSMHENPSFAAIGLELGAMGFLSKHATPDEFILAINTVMKGKIYMEPAIAGIVPTTSAGQTQLSHLTPREVKILSMITNGFTYEQIALNLDVGNRTVSNVSATLRKKLSARNLSDLIRLGIEMGVTETQSTQGPES